ncbi:MAG: hypothetical protein NW224_23800 [Leptolyngbyaceae cyanobacterium bins.302]|nr:hypothetical protein [Leptolyngbyaceae cyanobacterium bins.302]
MQVNQQQQTMFPFDVVILDVDGSITRQHRLIEQYQPTILRPSDDEEALYYMDTKTIAWLQHLVRTTMTSDRPRIAFYGSNLHHHLAYLWISLAQEPITVINFDAHTDLFRSVPGIVWHGSWAPASLRLPQVQKIIMLGQDRDLNGDMWTMHGFPDGTLIYELDWLQQGKVEIYPTTMEESVFQGSLKANLPFATFEPKGVFQTQAHWQSLRGGEGFTANLKRIVQRIETEAVHITIDKDGLQEPDAYTNLYGDNKQGTLTLDELLEALQIIQHSKRIVGVDICGDYFYPTAKRDPLRRWFSEEMQKKVPEQFTNSDQLRQINEETNLRILAALQKQDTTPATAGD